MTSVTSPDGAAFRVLRDDLSHPYISGNKRRKLDGLWPELVRRGVRDVVTCGGSQSAHVVAVAAAAAEHGMRAHLLLRGEQPAVPTGNHLFARMLAHTTVYVTRAEYADRVAMLSRYAAALREWDGAARVAVVPEGGAEAAALLGMVRLVHWMAGSREFSGLHRRETTMVVDSGTGTTAVGLALGAALLDLPWTVTAVTLAGPEEYYAQQAVALVGAFCRKEGLEAHAEGVAAQVAARLRWTPRREPRKFGKVLPGEVLRCKEIAVAHGVVLDPIWTLAAWESAAAAAAAAAGGEGEGSGQEVVMIHTGGTLGLCGLAQRFPEEF